MYSVVFRRMALLVGCLLLIPVYGINSATARPSLSAAQTSSAVPSVADSADTIGALRTGVLANGMHYYIQRNPFPTHRAMLWLAVNAGAIQEDPDQQGFAHFVEHMAFNGTRNFPGNSLIDVIERAGLNFGADLNAYTSFDETVYQLSIPTDNDSAFHQGLQIVEDWASGGITFDSTTVIGERGVVLGEWRQRLPDTMSRRLQRDMLARVVGDSSRYVNRFPIGQPELIRGATPTPLQRFYHDWYRSDLMAIIAVGDFDARQMEKTIKTRFGRIPARAHPRAFTRPSIAPQTTTVVKVVRDQLPPEVSVTWPMPITATDVQSRVSQEITETLLAGYVQHALTKLSQQERRAFAGSAFRISRGAVRTIGRQATLVMRMSPDSAGIALATALSELERVAQHGLAAQELESRKAALLRRWEKAADGEAAIPSKALAEEYVSHYLTGDETLVSPTQRLAIARVVLPGITVEQIAKMAASWRTNAGRMVIVQIPRFASVRTPTSDEIIGIMDSVRHISFAAWGDTDTQPTRADGLSANGGPISNNSHSSAPMAKPVVDETVDNATGITTWTLTNGARVVYKSSKNNPDQIILHATSPGGYGLLPDSLFYSSGRLVADLITASGSLGATTHEQLAKTLQTTGVQQMRVTLNAFNEEIHVSGSPRELETLFELLYRQFTEAMVDTTALSEWRRTGGGTLTWSPNDRFAYMNSGDRRLAPPSAVNVPFMNISEAMAVFRDRFGDASDFTFYIIGASSVDQVKPLVEKYIATLPSTHRTKHEQPRTVKVKPLVQKIVQRDSVAQLQAEQSMATIGYMGRFTDSADTFMTERARINALSWILSRRLRIRLREEMSVTYGASAPVSFHRVPTWFYEIGIQFMTSPNDMEASVRAAWEEINSLRSTGPTAEELVLVAEVQRRQAENAQQSNGWWITQMQICDQMKIPFSVLASTTSIFGASDIIAAAKRYLPEQTYLQRTQYPTKKTIDEANKSAQHSGGGISERLF